MNRFGLLALAFAAAGCSSSTTSIGGSSAATVAVMPAVAVPLADSAGIVRIVVESKALEGNLLGDSARRKVAVYLPRDYATSGKRYRTVYLLHGFGARRDGHNTWVSGYRGFHMARTMDSLSSAGVAQEMILVAPDASNYYGGAFYRDSPVAGGWETFIVRELVGTIDATFRTIPKRESRGLAGHSMGGFGTLSLAAKYPEIFGAAYALSPCCIVADENPQANPAAWKVFLGAKDKADVLRAGFFAQVYAALSLSIAPNTSNSPLMFDLPVREDGDRFVAVPDVIREWRSQSPYFLLDSLSGNLRKLRGFAFDAGRQDNFRDIPVQTPRLDSLLTRNKVPHWFELYDGDHSNRIGERMKTKVIPFFDSLLAKQKDGR